jgi:peroxiredoxin
MIKVGDRIPEGTFKTMTDEGANIINTNAIFAGKKVVFFGVPGAFTPGCSKVHLPGYVANIDAIRATGIDSVVCMAVNDVFVMGAWSKDQGADGKVLLVSDGSAVYAKALGLAFDLSHAFMGVRCRRFSMVVNDGVVESVNVDERAIEATTAQNTCGL